jgi:hypothetical protein
MKEVASCARSSVHHPYQPVAVIANDHGDKLASGRVVRVIDGTVISGHSACAARVIIGRSRCQGAEKQMQRESAAWGALLIIGGVLLVSWFCSQPEAGGAIARRQKMVRDANDT